MNSVCRLMPALLAAAVLLGGGLAAWRANAQEASAAEVERLIEQLGSQEYITRQRAERELLRLGSEVFDALADAEDHPDLEIAARARYLTRRITIDWVRESDHADVKGIMAEYDEASDEGRLERVRQLIVLPQGQGIPALVRIVRFEKSQTFAKRAAVAWLESDKLDESYWRQSAELIERHLSATRRPAAGWIRAQLLAITEPQAALAAWEQMIKQEQQTLAATPENSDTQIVLALMRRKVSLLKELGRNDEAVATMIEMIDLEDGNAEALTRLVEWLVKEKAWGVIDEVAQRFGSKFEHDWTLIYLLAEARAAQGLAAEAETLAEKAFKLDPSEPARHLRAGFMLQKRGLFDWAQREYRYVITLGPAASRTAMFATVWLAEMLHDQAQELPAAEVLQKLVEAMDKDATVLQGLQRISRDPEAVRSRMDYFFSLHFASQGDRVKQKEHLDRAIQHDPSDADVLIAMYRFPDADDEFRAKTLRMIEAAAVQFEGLIEEFSDDATGYNQYAWLIGNTEGDIDKAIRYSHRSLELRPATAGYLDTLAHCYYTKGDYANAVRYQEQAVDLEPHSGQLSRPLEKFRQALEESKAVQ